MSTSGFREQRRASCRVVLCGQFGDGYKAIQSPRPVLLNRTTTAERPG